MRNIKGISAWLIVWDSSNRAKIPRANIAAILSPRLGGSYISKIVELLYANACYTYSERIRIAAGKRNPYSSEYGRYGGEIICGANPYLEAFLVDDLKTITDEDGQEKIIFKKRQKPTPKW